jgi:type IV pilus assembly protein PilF
VKITWRHIGLNTLAAGFVLAAMLALAGCASNQAAGSAGELVTASDQTEIQRRAQIRLQLAIGYYTQNQLPTALDEIKQALAIDPNLPDAYGVRGLIYMDMGENALAEENFQRAFKLAPNNPDNSNNYGWFLCRNGREKESIAYFERAVNNPAYRAPAKALNNAGACSLKLHDMAAAERYLTRAFQFDPGNLDTNTNMAKLYYARSDYQRARFYITRVTKAEKYDANVLWTAIRIERKLGDRTAETSLATQLRRRYPNSPEFASYLRRAFDE